MRTAHELIKETSEESAQELSKNASQKLQRGLWRRPTSKGSALITNPRYEDGLPSEQGLCLKYRTKKQVGLATQQDILQ